MFKLACQFLFSLTVDHLILLNFFLRVAKKVIDGYLKKQTNQPSIKKNLAIFTEKAMAPPLQYSCLGNPMDGGAS